MVAHNCTVVVVVEACEHINKTVFVVDINNGTLLNEEEIGTACLIEAILMLLEGDDGIADHVLSRETVLADGDICIAGNFISGRNAAENDLNGAAELCHDGADAVLNGDVGIFAGDGHAEAELIVTDDLLGAAESFDKLKLSNALIARKELNASEQLGIVFLDSLGNGIGECEGHGITRREGLGGGYPYIVGNAPIIIFDCGFIADKGECCIEDISLFLCVSVCKSRYAERRDHKHCDQHRDDFFHDYFSFS